MRTRRAIGAAIAGVVALLGAAYAPAGAETLQFTHDVARAEGALTSCAVPPTATCYGVFVQAWDAKNTNWAETNAWANLYRVDPTSTGFALTPLGGTWAEPGVSFTATDGLRRAHLLATFALHGMDGNGLTVDASWAGTGSVTATSERQLEPADLVSVLTTRTRVATMSGSVDGVGWQQATVDPAPAPVLKTWRTTWVDA